MYTIIYIIYIYIAYSGRLQKLMRFLANVDSNDYYAYASDRLNQPHNVL